MNATDYGGFSRSDIWSHAEEIADDFRNGMSITEIQDKWNVSNGTAYNIVKSTLTVDEYRTIKAENKKKASEKWSAISESRFDSIKETFCNMYRKGHSIEYICLNLELNPDTMRKYVMKWFTQEERDKHNVGKHPFRAAVKPKYTEIYIPKSEYKEKIESMLTVHIPQKRTQLISAPVPGQSLLKFKTEWSEYYNR